MRIVEEERDAAREALGAFIDLYYTANDALVRVRAIVDEYGDDFEPEDGWRYTRDLLAALNKGTGDE